MTASILNVTVGTAGHIDHGKTTLVRRLVGAKGDVDRLEEEQRRGMTIEVGYAELTLEDGTEIGLVDVPGHEKFIRNMVAGASGMDVVVLVVAADDGVMPQTREHLEIMTLLGIRTGLVALTKVDLVDEELREIVEDDVTTFLRGTFLEGAPVHHVSGETGEGIDELRVDLVRLARAVEPRDDSGLFRLPIQRVFTQPGYGAVVTGIPVQGRVRVGDRVEILPRGLKGRVRGLEAYHHEVEEARAGHRTAMNLSDVNYKSLARGDVVATPGMIEPTSLFEARVRLLAGAPRPMKAGDPARLHVGTSVVGCRLVPLEAPRLGPGEEGYVQIRTETPVVVGPDDRFVLRRASPATTLGGGRVLGASNGRLRALKESTIEALRERERGLDDPRLAIEATLRARRDGPVSSDELARALLVWPDRLRERLAELRAAGRVVRMGAADQWFHVETFAFALDRLRRAFERAHGRARMKDVVAVQDVRDAAAIPGAFEAALQHLEATGEVIRDDEGRVRLASHAVALDPRQVERLDRLEALFREELFQPPLLHDLPTLLGALPDEVMGLIDLLVQRGRFVRLAEGIYLHADALETTKRAIREHEKSRSGLTAAEIRTALGTTRKYLIPLLERLDATGFTVRRGDLRVVNELL